jgi:hypothetical protein
LASLTFASPDNSKIANDFIAIKNAVNLYFNQVKQLPNTVYDLIEFDYLTNKDYPNFQLLNNNGRLSIAINSTPENVAILKNYILDSAFDEQKQMLIVKLNPQLSKNNTIYQPIFFCSNLYCPNY